MSKHTPGPWRWWACKETKSAFNDYIQIAAKLEHVAQVKISSVTEHDMRLIAAAPELKAVSSNFEITGPDDDGLLWLVLYGNGTTGKAMFNLGRVSGIAGQVALLLEQDRRAAIAKAEGGAV